MFLKPLITKCVVIFIAIIYGLLLPILMLSFTPIYIFRKLLSMIANRFHPEFGKILTTYSTNFSCDRLYTAPNAHTVVTMTIKGQVPFEEIKNAFTNRVLVETLPNGELRYPELKQFPVSWFGFKFWKNDPNFKLENYVKRYKSPKGKVTDEDLHEISQDLLTRPFQRDLSPWGYLMVDDYVPSDPENYGVDKGEHLTVAFLRIHHTIADGYSIMKLIIEGITGKQLPKLAATKFHKRNFPRRVLFSLAYPFMALYEFAELIFLSFKKSPWHINDRKRTYCLHAVTRRIPTKMVKVARRCHNVSFTSVIVSACTGAMREIMVKEGMRLPNDVLCVLPFPLPNHPDKLRNHMSQAIVTLPLEYEDPVERIRNLNGQYEAQKRSALVILNKLVGKCIGGLFIPMVKVLLKSIVPSVLITNMPAGSIRIVVSNYDCIDCYFLCGLLDIGGLAFYTLSYSDSVRLVIVADSSLISQDSLNEMAKLIEKEIDILGTSAIV